MEITLDCGGTVDPLAVPAKDTTFRCSRGCEHPLLDDHRALILEAASRRASNAQIAEVRKSRGRWKTAALWAGSIAGLAGVDFTVKHAAAQTGGFLPRIGVVAFVAVCLVAGLYLAVRARSQRGW